MRDKYFIDTNIFVYAFDKTDTGKQQTADALIKKAISEHSGCISFQVIQEFMNVSTRKFEIPLSTADCQKYLNGVFLFTIPSSLQQPCKQNATFYTLKICSIIKKLNR